MAILGECPICHNKQSTRNKNCKCGADLDKAKRSKKVKYWINFRMPDGKQRREYVGNSIKEARDADGKRRVQKRENRIFDMLPESNMTFVELTDWYLTLKSVKKLRSFNRLVIALNNFNDVFGNRIIDTIKPIELEDYQEKREEQGRSAATIDMEITIAKTMIIKAFDNDMVDGRILKAFRTVKRKLRKGSNARKRTLTFDEYLRLIDVSPQHLKACFVIAFNTGMRVGEIRLLKWKYIDRKEMFIRLPKEITKEKKAKNIPINHHVKNTLNGLPRALQHDYVITYKGKPIKEPGGLKNSFKTACQKSEISCGQKVENGIIFHDIRRTVKTNMLSAGIDKTLRDVTLGHSLQGMDIHYIAPSGEVLRKAMDKYTQWLDGELNFANVDQTVDQAPKKEIGG